MPDEDRDGGTAQATVSEADVERALDRHADSLMTLPNVVGVGSTPHPETGEPAVAVYVSTPPARASDGAAVIPDHLDIETASGRKIVRTHMVTVGDISVQSGGPE